MPGFCALSIDAKKYKSEFLSDLFWQVFYEQHLGEDYAGIATCEGGKVKIRTHRGLFRPTFGDDMGGLEGTMGVGYCGDSREPILVDSKLGEFAACFTGNVINQSELVARLKTSAHSFAWGGADIEVITKLIPQGEGYVDGIQRMNEQIQGAYSVAVLTPNGIYIASDPSGRWPVVLGTKEGAVVATTDPCGFANFGFRYQRDVEPGEIVRLRNDSAESVGKIPGGKTQICTFVWVYTNFPSAVFKGIPVSAVRKRLGATLARRDIERGFTPDVVAPVPDSGRFCAIGYQQEFCRQSNEKRIDRVPEYDEVLMKYPYAGRSYPRSSKMARDTEAQVKQLGSGESYSGKRIVVCDDSVRRGTQIERDLVPKLRALGAGEIHFRISNPDSFSYCRWGKSIKKGELLAARIPSIRKRISVLGIDSLEHTTVRELAQAIGLSLETLCIDCDLPAQSSFV